MRAWDRVLGVILTSTSKKLQVSYGLNDTDNLEISISGNKYLSALKDNFSVTITNLTYNEVVRLIAAEMNEIQIVCGYKHGGSRCIFKGGCLAISNQKQDASTNSIIFICPSKLVSIYNKQRLNLTLNSGINMYSALSIICKQAGINNPKISKEFKSRLLTQAITTSSSAGNIIEQICNQNTTYVVNADASYDSGVSVWDAYREDTRVIPLSPKNIIVANGYPTLSSSGLTLYVLPVFNFMPGDVIQIDNAYIDISQSSKDEVLSEPNKAIYLDPKGEYMIHEIAYTLTNRGSQFSLRLLCKRRSLLKGVTNNGRN